MRGTRIRLAAIVAITAGLSGCGAPTPVRRSRPDPDGSSVSSGGDDASGPVGGGSSTGGSDGTGGGGTGGQDETGGTGGIDAGSGGDGGSGGTVGETADAAAGGTGGASGSTGTGGAPTGGSGGSAGTGSTPDAGSTRPEAGVAVPGDGTTALCFTDPTVIAICKQLEPACQNCPDKSIWNECFDVAAAGDDRACARYAVTNKCTVDVGGNTCGSLNCRAAGCNRSACMAAQGEGDTTMCEPLMKSCPCK